MPAAIKWTPELEGAIIERVTGGESIVKIAEDESMPCESSIWVHAANDDAFQSAIARAMDTRTELDIERCRHEAEVATADNWQVAQLRIRTYQWEAGKRKPKKYGERVQNEHTGKDGGPMEFRVKSILEE